MEQIEEYLKGNVIAGPRLSIYDDDSKGRLLTQVLESMQGYNVLSDETKGSIPGINRLIPKEDSGDTIEEDPSEDESNGKSAYQLYEDVMKEIEGRPEFSYSAENDPIYQQYRSAAEKSGSLAMKDTVAQIAALNGGYANSYAQTAGQQTYQSALDSVDNMIPELYEISRKRYESEGDELWKRANSYLDAYSTWEKNETERIKAEIEANKPKSLTPEETKKAQEYLGGLETDAENLYKDGNTNGYKDMYTYIKSLGLDEEGNKEMFKRYGLTSEILREIGIEDPFHSPEYLNIVDDLNMYVRNQPQPYELYNYISKAFSINLITENERDELISIYCPSASVPYQSGGSKGHYTY